MATLTAPTTPEHEASTFVPDVLGRGDYRIISEMVEDGSRVLDLGCGEGSLMAWLEQTKRAECRGVEISPKKVRQALSKGLSVYQGDIDRGLEDYPDEAFDYVILSQTLQEAHKPREVLREMMRVGRRGIVAFPNFGHWSARLSLLWTGRAPKTKHLPYEWYETPNIHFVTVPDFDELLRSEGIAAEKAYFLRGDKRVSIRPTLFADTAVYLLKR